MSWERPDPVRDEDWGGDDSDVAGCVAVRIITTEGVLVGCGNDPPIQTAGRGRLAQGSSPSREKWERYCPATSAF